MYNNRQYHNQNRINTDRCYQLSEAIQSKSIQDYSVFNYYPTNRLDCPNTFHEVLDFSYPNYMNVKDGYHAGGGCRINSDSRLRNDKAWNKSRERTQLPTRVFQAVPDLSTGNHEIDVSNRLVLGSEDTRTKKSCNVIIFLLPLI